MHRSQPRTSPRIDPCLAGRILLKLDVASAAIFADVLRLQYNKNERRDSDGEWTDGESGGPSSTTSAASKTKKDYQDEAAKIVGHTPDKVEHPSVMNRRITAAYAHMYLSNPAFQWAGMAAFASSEVGRGMQEAQNGALRRIAEGNDIRDMLATGNWAVYNDIYWQFLAYKKGGMAEMGRLLQNGDIPHDMYLAWQLIDLGTRNNDPSAVSAGNKKILEHEQNVTLKEAIYDDSTYADWANYLGSRAEFTSPVPGDPNGFQTVVPNGKLAKTADRWKWIDKSVWPAWQKYEKMHKGDIRRSMDGYDQNYYPNNPK